MDAKKLLSTILARGADVDRWKVNATQQPKWDERNRTIASFIPAGSSVVDAGAGAQTLRGHLPEGCRYQPVDIVPKGEGALYANFNTKEIPSFTERFDVSVCSGVLEYMLDPAWFVQTVASWGKVTYLSYSVLDLYPDVKSRAENDGWITHFSIVELDELFTSLGLSYRIRARWKPQLIYELRARE
jgi:hypothetical protein